MKKVQLASFLLLVLTLLVMAVNRFAAVLPDWAVRTVGVMLLSLPAASCCVVKGCMKKQIKTGERGVTRSSPHEPVPSDASSAPLCPATR